MSAAKQVMITQGTPEWLDWRRGRMTASDQAALQGESPYKTRRDVWFEKAGLGEPEDEDRSWIFRRGHETEAELRELFSAHANIEIMPTCFEKGDIYGASLDGYDKHLGVFEAKLVGKEVLKTAKAKGEIPRHHWIQIQAQLHASDSDKAFWGGRAPTVKGGVVVEFGRDEKFIKKMCKDTEAFWQMLDSNTVPELTDQDTLFIIDPVQVALFKELASLKEKKDLIEGAYSELEAKAKALAVHAKVKCGSATITEVLRAGSIDYNKIPEVVALAEDYLESFRKRASKYKQIRFSKGG